MSWLVAVVCDVARPGIAELDSVTTSDVKADLAIASALFIGAEVQAEL